jgi:DeoR/GlpR family transcriptional regulator of sugar metabolism
MLLCDHSKFDLLTLENVCPLDTIKLIVADRAPTGELARAIKRAGLPVELANSDPRDGGKITRRLAAQREG